MVICTYCHQRGCDHVDALGRWVLCWPELEAEKAGKEAR